MAERAKGVSIVGTATRRMILLSTVALFSIVLIPGAPAQIPDPSDVQDTADDATQGAQDAVDDVQDTADNATQGAQDAVDDVQDTADNATQGAQDAVDDAGSTASDAQQDVQEAVGDTAESAVDKASTAVPGSSEESARRTVKQLSGTKSSTTVSDDGYSPADLAELVAGGQSIEGTNDTSADERSDRSGLLERVWNFFGLPLTGAELLAVVAVGVMFISAGVVLWRRARSRTVSGPRDGAVRHT